MTCMSSEYSYDKAVCIMTVGSLLEYFEPSCARDHFGEFRHAFWNGTSLWNETSLLRALPCCQGRITGINRIDTIFTDLIRNHFNGNYDFFERTFLTRN